MEKEDQETNGRLDAPAKWKSPATRMTSVNFDANLWDQAKNMRISLKDAIEFGIRFLVADQDGFDYPQSNLLEKLHKTVKHRNALVLEVDALRQQVAGVEDLEDQTEKDFNQVFGEVKE